ncbi:hypothetical protein, variant [Batrachochytrium dendrobatidis JEL423]|uniref:3-hydroxyisobutyryl-CoA hydrolase n=1 Tax=Batrachochytrium dendrobatidis (strain JEL423) TaxID=403673 RepID=A0A177W802_BATDL|nr:hypothetical protein BDEG_20024 [Batrachochytrium dendrobatidis JEL423]OAJ35785.1 hypothetical protein, variant [Batrachochytrium dendrobatidis JEL423]
MVFKCDDGENMFEILNDKKWMDSRDHHCAVAVVNSDSSTNKLLFSLMFTGRSTLTAAYRLKQTMTHLASSSHIRVCTATLATSSENSASVGVNFKKMQSIRKFELDRPAAMNALNLDMVYAITSQLKVSTILTHMNIQTWKDSDLCKVIVLANVEGSRAFCAALVLKASSGKPEDIAQSCKFMEEEYKLNHMIATLKLPFVSIMDGITMGGGVGLSVHGSFRIATEKTLFAMPETAIGLFPDVGGSFFLPRLDGELGTFLGLTGHRLKGEEVFIAGIASHFIPSSRLSALYSRLQELDTNNIDVVNAAIDEFSGDFTTDMFRNWSLGGEVGRTIDRCFKYNTIEEIFAALEKDPNTEWCQKQLQVMRKCSPTSLKATLMQLRKGAKKSIADCLKMEYRMVRAFMEGPDFHQGVTAALINKPATRPNWKPDIDHMNEISASMVEKKYFAADQGKQLELFTNSTYYDYPHRSLSGLPTDRDIRRVVYGDISNVNKSGSLKTKSDILQWFMQNWGKYDSLAMSEHTPPLKLDLGGGLGRGKVGLKAKVESVLETHTEQQANHLEWKY